MIIILNFKIYQLDIKADYLNDDLNEEIYIEDPKDYKG